jgi:hypothetical protein
MSVALGAGCNFLETWCAQVSERPEPAAAVRSRTFLRLAHYKVAREHLSTTCFVTILAFCRAATLKHFDSSNKNIYLVFWLQRRTTLSEEANSKKKKHKAAGNFSERKVPERKRARS